MAAIHQRGWCDGTGGNFSCVLKREPLLLLMAPSGVDKGRVQPQELIVVDCDSQVSRGSGRASAETLLHLAIVNETGAGAVLHTHSQAGTLLSQWSWAWAVRSAPAARTLKPEAEALEGGHGVKGLQTRAGSRSPPAEAGMECSDTLLMSPVSFDTSLVRVSGPIEIEFRLDLRLSLLVHLPMCIVDAVDEPVEELSFSLNSRT
jgi:methylthioribulose-1-phosphate dehydratase